MHMQRTQISDLWLNLDFCDLISIYSFAVRFVLTLMTEISTDFTHQTDIVWLREINCNRPQIINEAGASPETVHFIIAASEFILLRRGKKACSCNLTTSQNF